MGGQRVGIWRTWDEKGNLIEEKTTAQPSKQHITTHNHFKVIFYCFNYSQPSYSAACCSWLVAIYASVADEGGYSLKN